MAKKNDGVATLANEIPDLHAKRPPPENGFDRAELKDPLLRLAQAVLGPFVAHKDACDGDPCTCGLAAAVAEIQRREILIRRYGLDG